MKYVVLKYVGEEARKGLPEWVETEFEEWGDFDPPRGHPIQVHLPLGLGRAALEADLEELYRKGLILRFERGVGLIDRTHLVWIEGWARVRGIPVHGDPIFPQPVVELGDLLGDPPIRA